MLGLRWAGIEKRQKKKQQPNSSCQFISLHNSLLPQKCKMAAKQFTKVYTGHLSTRKYACTVLKQKLSLATLYLLAVSYIKTTPFVFYLVNSSTAKDGEILNLVVQTKYSPFLLMKM